MFIPKRILFERNTLNYDIGQNIYNFFKNDKGIEIIELNNNRIKAKNFKPANHLLIINCLYYQVALGNASTVI